MTSIDAESIKLWFSAAALIFSLVSLYFTKVNWVQSNRPIVVAYVTEHHAGNGASTFNLVLLNSGSRPAVRIRLVASHDNIRKLMAPGVPEARFRMIEHNFLSVSEVPLLGNGERLITSFGAFTPNSDTSWLNYGAETEIVVAYQDLNGRKFKSALPLKIYARDGFGGGIWDEPATSTASVVYRASSQ
jgi:hypothetical protein